FRWRSPMLAHRERLISSATAAACSAASRTTLGRPSRVFEGVAAALNKTSIKPDLYGERFVKCRGLFCLAVASRPGVVRCVSRQDNDRSAVHQLDKDRSRR